MRRTILWLAVFGVLAAAQLPLWYSSGQSGGGYAGPAAMLLALVTLTIVFVLTYRAARSRSWRRVALFGALPFALATGIWGAMGAGIDAFFAQQTALTDELRARIDELDREITDTTAVKVTERFPEYGRAWARRTRTGQLVVQFNSRLGRRGMVYLSRDDLNDAQFPKWFAFTRVRPCWYIWLGTG